MVIVPDIIRMKLFVYFHKIIEIIPIYIIAIHKSKSIMSLYINPKLHVV